MDYPKRIRELLEKYWEADTTLEEERELKSYFLLHADQGDATAGYFLFLQSEKETDIPAIASLEQNSRSAKIRPMWIRVTAIAASIALLVFAVLTLQQIQQESNEVYQNANVQVVEDPEQAYKEAKQALLLVAEKMQTSQAKAAKQIDKVEPYTTILK